MTIEVETSGRFRRLYCVGRLRLVAGMIRALARGPFRSGDYRKPRASLAATEAPEPLTGSATPSKNSIGSTNTVIPEDKLLSNPDFFPAPPSPVRSRSRLAMVGGLIGVILAIALTAFIVGQFPLADVWLRLTVERAIELASSSARPAPAIELSTPRLIVHPRVLSGEPAALGLAVQGRAEGAIVIITGLPPGMELSKGDAVAADAWRIAATELAEAWIAAPESFLGSADLIAELRLPGNKIADRLTIQLEWVPPILRAPTQHQPDREEIATAPPILPEPAPLQLNRQQFVAGPPISPEPTRQPARGAPDPANPTYGQADQKESSSPISTAPTPRQLDMEEIAVLPKRGKDVLQPLAERATPPAVTGPPPAPAMSPLNSDQIAALVKVGEDLLHSGDLAAARTVLKRAALAGNPRAALELGMTFDQAFLTKWGVVGFGPDLAQAREWYERAIKLGSTEASRHLERLASMPK